MKRANDEPDKENIPPKPKKLIVSTNNVQNFLSIPSTTNNPSQTISSSSCSSANSSDKCQELFSFDENNTLNSQCSQNTQTQEPKQISAELINELISRSKLQPLTSQVFMDVVYIVEMFNKVVYSMNHRDNTLSKIDFVRFFRSIRSNDENAELSKLLRMLFGILIKTLRHTDIQLFNLPLNRIDLEQISAINLARSLMKSMRTPIKKLVFREYCFEDELKRVETLGHLSLHVKIKLCFRLVEYLGFEMNDTKSHVKEYLLKEKEFEDELDKLKAKIDILSAVTYNRGQKDLYLKLKEERRSLAAQLNQLQSDLNEMKGTRSLISLELDDSSGDFISLWQFDCLPGCLMLERFKPIELREEISFTQSQSNWYLVSDSECLSKLFEMLKINRLMSYMTEWRVEKDIKDNQEYLNEVSLEITAPISTSNQLIDDEKSKTILNKLVDIRDRIVASRRIAYEIEFNQTDKSFSSFNYNTEHNQMFDLALNGPNDQMIEKLKFLLECAYLLIDKTCLGKLYWNNWKREIEEIQTLSELELMIYLFESNISWDNEPVCLMCLTRGELDQREEISLADGPVVQCANCEIAYHLRCITDCEEKQEHNLFNLRAQILCSECYMVKLSNDEVSRRARI